MKITNMSIVVFLLMTISTYPQNVVDGGNFSIVVGDNVNLRNEPNLNSIILTQLDLAKMIKVVKRSGKMEQVGNHKGEWVFIDAMKFIGNSRETYKGWVFDYYLASQSQFIKISSFPKCKIDGAIGDSHLYYEINADGKFVRKDVDRETRKTIHKTGSLYRYRNVIVAVDDDGEDMRHVYFYINNAGNMCHYSRYKNGEPVYCSTCRVERVKTE